MFNMPRAAINFNDGMGGGDVVDSNVIFNTCRESGDHGPINSWDRQPFLTTLLHGTEASFDPLPRRIESNFIFANFGGSQGVDNDDGSSWFNITSNVFYFAEGFKMDYGGHDSHFSSNLILAYPYDGQQCVNLGGFKEGHGHAYENNRCVVGLGGKRTGSGCGDPSCAYDEEEDPESLEKVVSVAQCDPAFLTLRNNEYFTTNGTAVFECSGTKHTLAELQGKGLEEGSRNSGLPDEEEMLAWARGLLPLVGSVVGDIK